MIWPQNIDRQLQVCHRNIEKSSPAVNTEAEISLGSGGSVSAKANQKKSCVLESGETILETESLIDIAAVVSRYAFGNLVPKNKTVQIAQYPNAQKINWMD